MPKNNSLTQIFVVGLLVIFLISSISTWFMECCKACNTDKNLLTDVTLYTFSFIGTIVAGFYGVSIGANKSFHRSFGEVLPSYKKLTKTLMSQIYVFAYLSVGIFYLVGLVMKQDSDFYSKIVMSFLGLVTAIVSVYFKPESSN